MLERLQKILSARGVASRRTAEEYIRAGLVTVNGTVATIGQKADTEKDIIEVHGKVLEARQKMLYYVMQKPMGVVTENVARYAFPRSSNRFKRATPTHRLVPRSPEAKGESPSKADEGGGNKPTSNVPTVRDLLPKNLQGKIYPVGRLDKESEGLLLFTNDGALAFRLMHPRFDHEKEYTVETQEMVHEGALRKLAVGIKLDGVPTKSARVSRIGRQAFSIAITEGRNRQIRRMCQKVGLTVIRLARVRIMTLKDAKLPSGEIRQLTTQERDALLKSMGM